MTALTHDFELAVGAFADDAVLAYWDGTGTETGARALARGRQAVRAALAAGALGPGRPEVLVELTDGATRLFEGRTVERGPLATFAASAQLDCTGAITRCLVYRTAYVEPSPTWAAHASLGAARADLFGDREAG